MREPSRNKQSRNNVKRTYELTRLLQFSAWNKGTHLHSIHDGDLEIVVCVRYVSPPLIFNIAKEVICHLIRSYRLNVLCASLCFPASFAGKAHGVSGFKISAVHVVCRLYKCRHAACLFSRMFKTASALCCPDTHQ